MNKNISVSLADYPERGGGCAAIPPSWIRTIPGAVLVAFLALWSLGGAAMGASINLAWNPSSQPGLTGYKVYYGSASRSYGTSVVLGNVTSCTIGRLPSGPYYFAVTAMVSSAESGFSNEVSATLQNEDNAPPVISAVTSSGITYSSATVTWSTSEAADTQVEYGKTTSYGSSTPLQAALLTAHSQTLSGLAAGTTYHYRVRSMDAVGNLAVSGDFIFVTGAPPDTTPPVISAVASSGVTSNAATITWSTNEASDTQVDYGTTLSYGLTTPLNATRSTAHTQALSGLAAGTTYHYRVKSRDAAGNLAISNDFVFTTAKPVNIATGLVAAFSFDEGAGSTAADVSGRGNHATLNGAAWSSTARYGKALSFNGSQSYVTAGVAGLPAINAPKTIAFWFYLSNTVYSNQSIVAMMSGAMNAAVIPGVSATQANVRKSSGAVKVSAPLPALRTWHHFACSFDGTTHRLYLDGIQVGSSTIAPDIGTVSMFQMGRRPGRGEYFNGLLDELRVYARALNLAELQAVMTTPVAAAAGSLSLVEGCNVGLETPCQNGEEYPQDANPGAFQRPRPTAGSVALDFSVSQGSYGPGETVSIASYCLTNYSDFDQAVEMKTWIAGPSSVPVAIANIGEDGGYVVPAGLYEKQGPIPLFPVLQDTPGGNYMISARVMDPTTGDVLMQNQSSFTITSAVDSSRLFLAGTPEPNIPYMEWKNEFEDPAAENPEMNSQSGLICRNNGTDDVAVELKFWLEAPGQEPMPVFSLGSDGSLVLPAGSDIFLEPLSQWPSAQATMSGLFQLRVRMMDPATGQIMDESFMPVQLP